MLARRSNLYCSNGSCIKTPILIPSFSSKGWRFKKQSDSTIVSEIMEFIEWSKELLTDSVLFSAYDLYYKFYPGPAELGEITDITFIDSGGYETLEDHDLTSVYTMPWPIKLWDESKLHNTLKSLPKEHNIVIVNYDDAKSPKPIKDQIENASLLFSQYPFFLHDFLIRTETKTQHFIKIDSILKHISSLRNFTIIGVTEKELGNTLLERMESIARLRLALDEQDIKSPIHVFGSLDPITSCLYFISGAEIFDGLTWLRYAYKDGLTIYTDNYRFIERSITEKIQTSEKFILHDNLQEIKALGDDMASFVLEGDFNKFSHHGDTFEKAFDRLQSKFGRRL